MSDIIVLIFPLLLIGLPIYHILRLGTYYINFDGDRYEVWQRKFMGFDDLKGFFNSEQSARNRIEVLKANPPRVIRP